LSAVPCRQSLVGSPLSVWQQRGWRLAAAAYGGHNAPLLI
jgi:hypothetical protein